MNNKDNINFARDNFKVVSSEVISEFNEGYIGKKTIKYTLNDGTIKIVDQILKRNSNGDAVVIIPFTDTNKCILIVESRPNTSEEVVIEYPAGMIDEDELPVDAALRELSEETGYQPSKIYELEWHYQDQGCSKAKIYTYVALDCKLVHPQNLDDGEKIVTIELTMDEVMELINNNEIVDANTKIAVLTYSLKKRI